MVALIPHTERTLTRVRKIKFVNAHRDSGNRSSIGEAACTKDFSLAVRPEESSSKRQQFPLRLRQARLVRRAPKCGGLIKSGCSCIRCVGKWLKTSKAPWLSLQRSGLRKWSLPGTTVRPPERCAESWTALVSLRQRPMCLCRPFGAISIRKLRLP